MSGRGKSQRSLDLISAARTILQEIQPAPVRAVCYKLFTQGIIAGMTKLETNKVSAQLTWARENGVIPWEWIVDETREAERVSAWEDPAAYFQTVRRSYRRDRWTNQSNWIEVWSEKGTIRGTLAPVLNTYGITFRVMHGYGSATAVHEAATESLASSKRLTVLYVGDWDPSGMQMTEELQERLDEYGGAVDLIRLALTKADIRYGNLPSFPAADKGPKNGKKGDPRYGWFVKRFGSRCWELDALSPTILRARVEKAIQDRIDQAAWDRADIAEAAEKESITTLLNNWPGISRQAQKYPPERAR